MGEGVPEVEQAAPPSGLAFVFGDDLGLDAAAGGDRMPERVGIQRQQPLEVGLEE